MLSEKKLKILNDFIDSSEKLNLNICLNRIKPFLIDIKDIQLLLNITHIPSKLFAETIIGIYEGIYEVSSQDFSNYVLILGVSGTGITSVYNTFPIHIDTYNIYKQQLRLKKINNINKDVI